MASSRWKGDRHYGHLVEGTVKLHKDIDELETAYLLHRKIVDEDQNSVRGLIRKEVGGSRWAHGGAGKLTTYKSSKDLVDQENNVPSQETARSRQLSRDDQRLIQDNGKVPSSEFNNASVQNVGLDVKPDTILDLKTKVLKKASSHIIRRDSWAASDETKSVKDRNSSNLKKNESKQDVRKTSSSSKSQKPSSVKRSNSLKRENGDTSGSPTYVAHKAKDKQNKEQSQPAKKTVGKKESRTSQRDQSNRRSRLEMFNEIKINNIESTASLPSSEQKVRENGVHIGDKDSVDRPPTGVTYTPRKLQALNVRNSPRSSESQGICPTQPPEPTEIYIDPKTCQVRVAAAKEDHFKDLPNLEGTRVFIQPGSVHNSVEGNRLTCSIVDKSVTDSNRKNKIRDIFGLDEFKSHTDDGVSFYKTVASSSPLTTAKQCNTEVEFWLRSLGLPDVDKYVKIFADNDIDLTDLEFMSASQLHDMGVTAFGALDRILKGIRHLKNQSFNHATNHSKSKKSGHLTCSSIAWEEVDDNQGKIFSDVKQKASKKENPCHFQTNVKGSFDPISFDSRDRNFERSHSVLSHVSESVDTARLSARSETPNPSFAASTRSSSAKCVEKTRPPSAKCSSVKACVTSQSTSRNNNQSQSKTGSQSAVKLKRSNSSASEKSQSKMKTIENKPNKGVLLRPRSSSLTREASRLKNDKDSSVKRPDEKKEPRQLRARSRSADVVKRKALEGVQAAAKKFEVRNQKDSSKTLPPQDERKKIRRDEMAARHIQREKYKEITTTNDDSSDMDQDEHEQTLVDDNQNLHSLVTVNIISPQKKTDPHSATQNDKSVAHVTRPLVRRSLKSNRSRLAQSSVQPLNLQMETYIEPPLLASYKIGKKDRNTPSQSEHESGYKTDGSTSYSQIEDRVRDIQLKIKRLKARATSGDEMTLTLVRDLQEQLLHFERQLKEKEQGDRSQGSGSESHRGEMPDTNESKASATPRTPLSSARPSVNASTQSTYDTDNSNTETSTVTTVIQRVTDTGTVSRGPNGDSFNDGVRMSKQELLDEMRKEKQQHHLQIIQLQSELQRFKHSGPVSSLELDPKDISFKIEDKIGEGTFSRVYKGAYQGSEVAVKQLNVPLQQQDKNYFAAEVSLLKELRHPRVVLLIGVCTTSKLPVMVLEYMSCGSLHDYLHNPECESLDHALYYQVARDIASGMNYLHSHKPEVLHLDLKSMNVLLCQSLRAKIADFGFSKLRLDVGSKSGRKGKAKTNASIPAWMSPELLDKGEITGKSDVYSFGIILWEMLTRCFPYKGLSVFQVLEMVRKKSRPDIPDSTPEGLAHLINLCWDHNPAKRPQFKDVLQILENLAFPPAWRELFQKAGVPESALQDINSTRTIISLVTGTLDSGKSSILHSFMVAHGNKGNNSARSNRQELKSSFSNEKPLMKIKKSGKTSASNSKDSRTKLSSRSSNQTSDWDSDVISSLSDESELNLKNLRSSSDGSECEYDSDESSVLSFDEQSFVSKSKDTENTSKKAINVVIPNLALSIQSTRDELRAERQRITGEPDWLSISLDDRSQRSDIDQSFKTSHRNENSEIRLGLKSALSTRTPTPPCLANDEVAANESARSRRRSKSKDLGRYSDEFLRRESFDNRRPPSPKKKTPLTKKLIGSPCRSPAVSRMSLNEMRSKNDRVTPNSKIDSFVEKSYDSFFGHSSHESGMNALSHLDGGLVGNNRHVEDVDYESHHIHALKTEPCKVHSNSEPLGRKSSSNKDEICVEDMENEVELEMIRKETQVIDEAKSSSKNENGSISSQGLVSNQTNVTVDHVNGSMNFLDNKPEQKPMKPDFNITETLKENEQFKKGLEASLKCSVDNTESMTKSSAFNINEAETNCSSEKEANNTMQTIENDKLSRKLVIPEQTKSSKDKSKSASKSAELNTIQINEESRLFKKQMAGKLEPKSVEVEAKQNDIRVVLNEMLTSKDYITKSDTNISESSNLSSPRKSGVISDSKSMDYCGEEIRVKLNSEEVSRKKKPAITPRKSVKAKAMNNMTNIDLSNGSKTGEPSKVMPYSSKKIEDNIGGSDNKLIDCNNLVHENLNTDESAINSAKLTKSQKQDVIGIEHDRGKPKSRSKTSANSMDMIPSPKKKTIRVKLKKDPLVPQISREMSSPIPPPPPPPPPPQALMSKSVQVQAPRSSIADELKLRVANRQSISEGMLRNNKMSKKQNPGPIGRSMLVPKPVESGLKLMNIAELDETLVPQQSEGLPLMVQSMELRGQKDQLRSISKPHPQQFDDLSNASQEQLSSIADILKKAVMNRRLAMGEDGDSVSQSLESAATGWSIDA